MLRFLQYLCVGTMSRTYTSSAVSTLFRNTKFGCNSYTCIIAGICNPQVRNHIHSASCEMKCQETKGHISASHDILNHFKSRSDKPSVVSEGLCECGIYEVLHITMSNGTDTEKMRDGESGSVPAVQVTP